MRQATRGEVRLGTGKSGACQRPGPANRQLRPLLAHARRDLPLPKLIEGAIPVSKLQESGECRINVGLQGGRHGHDEPDDKGTCTSRP